MRELQWSEIDMCITCHALVPKAFSEQHDAWHDRIAAEAIRAAKQLEQIASPR